MSAERSPPEEPRPDSEPPGDEQSSGAPIDPLGDLFEGEEGLRQRRSTGPILLGDSSPLLPRAARWLVEEYGEAGQLDLEGTLVVVSGRRAGRTLLRHLVAIADRRMVFPPAIVTLGAAVEVLQPPRVPVAPALEELAVRAQTLGECPEEEIERAFGVRPNDRDRSAWFDLASACQAVEKELSAHSLSVRGALEVLTRSGAFGDLADEELERWRALAGLVDAAEGALGERGRQSRWLYRCRAARAPSARESWQRDYRRIVLVGLADVPRLHRQVFEASGLDVVVLVHAEEALRDRFDGWGVPTVDGWSSKAVSVAESRWLVGERPADQARLAVDEVQTHSRIARELPITVAVPDARMARAVSDALACENIGSHSPFGRPISQTQPIAVLRTLLRFHRSRRVDELARLLRFPVVLDWLRWNERLGAGEDAADFGGSEAALDGTIRGPHTELSAAKRAERAGARAREGSASSTPPSGSRGEVTDSLPRDMARAMEASDWLTLVDLYSNATLLRTVPRDAAAWRTAPGPRVVVAALRAVVQALDDLVERAQSSAGSGVGMGGGVGAALATLVTHLFSGHRPRPAAEDAQRGATNEWREWPVLVVLAQELAALDQLPEARNWNPLEATEALLALFREQGVEAGPLEAVDTSHDDESIEIVGWLEAAHDDAPSIVVVGLNEGQIPARRPVDPFLGGAARRALGLPGDAERLARDRFLLHSLQESRESLTLIAGRSDRDGQPLLPSRLLLAGSAERLARAVRHFFAEIGDGKALSRFQTDSNSTLYSAPPPRGDVPLPQTYRITSLRDYLQCPYRYYLRHVVGVETSPEPARELDASRFGLLAHDVLQRFALSALAGSTDAERIASLLHGELQSLVSQRLSPERGPAARLQERQLERRLSRFAQWQADQNRRGWRIQSDWVERSVSGTLKLGDGRQVQLVGRVDRVDVHPSRGVRVIDYKTSERVQTPQQTHLYKGQWVDLQLPLYRYLLSREGLADRSRVGYYCLSKRLRDDPWKEAKWDEAEFADALGVARSVIEGILAREFWPPREPPSYSDGLEWICGDPLPLSQRSLAPALEKRE